MDYNQYVATSMSVVAIDKFAKKLLMKGNFKPKI
jgi:hypothetical protein